MGPGRSFGLYFCNSGTDPDSDPQPCFPMPMPVPCGVLAVYWSPYREGYQRTFVKASARLYFCNSGTNRDSGPQPSSLSLYLCLWRPYRILESI